MQLGVSKLEYWKCDLHDLQANRDLDIIIRDVQELKGNSRSQTKSLHVFFLDQGIRPLERPS